MCTPVLNPVQIIYRLSKNVTIVKTTSDHNKGSQGNDSDSFHQPFPSLPNFYIYNLKKLISLPKVYHLDIKYTLLLYYIYVSVDNINMIRLKKKIETKKHPLHLDTNV